MERSNHRIEIRKDKFTIGELARIARVNVQTLRFYERRGILKPVGRKSSGYRLYNNESMTRLSFIRQAKELGFSLKEIQELLSLKVRTVSTCDRVRSRANRKLDEVRLKIDHLRLLEKTIRELISDCDNRKVSKCCPILEKMGLKYEP